jgi:phosphatidylserine/phosphatidylglycerophosphate/cardiolipin synthase-like enzyme
VDSPLHRALFPFHDVQARITGPAVKDLIQSFAERAAFDHGTPPFDVPAAPPQLDPPGSHLVQIGRTYFKPKSGPGFPFAPNGETVTHRTNLAAIKAARDFIYIEEQYFTPNDEYVTALMDAAGKAEWLIITVCMQNGQTFGPIRRTDVLAQLATAWGTRMRVGAPIRRFLNPTPAKTVNLGRCVLQEAITGSSPTITVGPTAHIPDPPFWAFVDNELMQVTASQPATDPGHLVLYVNRGPTGTVTNWGAKVDKHDENSVVMCVRVPHIYVHAKLMIIDDVFLSVGSANLNRRGHFHDGEINALTIPQHLKRDPANPARLLRCSLWAEHMGLTPEMGLSLLADPLSALPYFDRPWFAGNRWQPLAWAGVETDTQLGFSSSDSIAMEFLNLAVGAGEDAYKPTLWPLLVDPTCTSDPNSDKPGPEYPS